MSKYLIAIDQGTTSSRAIVFDRRGVVVGAAQRELPQIFPKPGWVEHDPMEILSGQLGVLDEAVARAGIRAADVAAIGVTNQRETTVVWDRRTGRPVHNAIVWQCRRTADYCDRLKESGFGEVIRARTGLVADAYFSGSKLRWLLENVPGARAQAESGGLLFGTVDTWLVWNLTGGKVFVTDHSNASRTMLFDIRSLEWDADILRELGIPAQMLPEVAPSAGVHGTVASGALCGVPIAGIAGDQQAALFGQRCLEPGAAKNTYGTGCFILMNTGDVLAESSNGLLSTIAWNIAGETTYALEGSVFVAGAALQWLRDGLGLISDVAQSRECAMRVPDSGGAYMVPAFVGLGAPHWDPRARGTIVGLTRGTTRDHVVRAALESIAFQSMDVIRAMEADSGISLRGIRADGGASANDFLMQFQADVLGTPVVRPRVIESTALGAARLAGLAVGFPADGPDFAADAGPELVFEPAMGEEERARLVSGWREAVGRTLGR